MWELWQWDGRYIKGKKLKRSKTKQTVMKHAEKHMEYDKIVKGNKKGEFFFEDEEGRAVGMLIEKQDAKKLRNELLALALVREITRMVVGSVISVTITLLVFKYLIWS